MKKLWQKNYQLNELAEKYCSGDNIVLDNELIIYDVIGSIAHAKMLHKIGMLTEAELIQIESCLNEIIVLAQKDQFKIQLGDEDVHTKVEEYLTKKLGEVGKKIHTGRSRNDQINVDLKLYAKDKLHDIFSAAQKTIESFIAFAKKNEFIPMPGYTHMQKAMPSSVGMWASSFAESLLDDLKVFETAYVINDQNPLGSGAAYGVSLPLDRTMTTKLLGFSKVQNNSLYAQVSRCKTQFIILHALAQIMLTLSRFAQDMLLFTTSEFDFFHVDEKLCTGSSIMPQKKNLDIMEILRAKTHTVVNYEHLTASILANLPSGYNADYAETKYPFMSAIKITLDSLTISAILIQSISLNKKQLQISNTPEIYATHAAYELVKTGVPFRDAYYHIAAHLDELPYYDPLEVLRKSNHLGGPGNLGLGKLAVSNQRYGNKTNKKD